MNEEVKDNTENESSSENTQNTSISDASEDKVAVLEKQVEELKDKYLRLYSDFDNAKKRQVRERAELIQTAGKEIMSALLPVLDDMERAMKAFKEAQDIESMRSGLELIYTKFVSTLLARGLQGFDATGETFDVERHEAVTEIPAPTEDLKGKVLDELEKGYFLNDRIIRYAKVVVGK